MDDHRLSLCQTGVKFAECLCVALRAKLIKRTSISGKRVRETVTMKEETAFPIVLSSLDDCVSFLFYAYTSPVCCRIYFFFVAPFSSFIALSFFCLLFPLVMSLPGGKEALKAVWTPLSNSVRRRSYRLVQAYRPKFRQSLMSTPLLRDRQEKICTRV